MVIKLLDKNTAEKIAAGEVIENPSSVVKELVENALDAEARNIIIEIEGGGKELIAVSDDGCGINPDDVELAFERFATSKLSKIDDLEYLSSLGFRGEALPSIAVVSKITMVTRVENNLYAVRISLEGGEVKEIAEAGAPFGTSVTVKELYFNTPGRKKFLRASSVESARISNLITSMALAHPHVSFTLKSGTRSLLHTNGDGQLLHVVGAVYGADTAKAMLELKNYNSEGAIALSGLISTPLVNRSSRKWITLIVNRRIVNNNLLSTAIIRAYGDQLPIRRFPVAILNMEISPNLIDVNVHPAKTEIRFLDPEAVKAAVYKSVKLTLPDRETMTKWPDKNNNMTENHPGHYSQFSLIYDQRSGYYSSKEEDQEVQNELTTVKPAEEGISDHNQRSSSTDQISGGDFDFKLIGQYLDSYIIVQKNDDLMLIDQHAAHERVIYNQVKIEQKANEAEKTAQLTIPYTIEVPVRWRELLPRFLPFLISLGIVIEPITDYSYAVRAVPLYRGELIKDFEIYDLLERLTAEDEDDFNHHRDALFKTLACHRSVKAKQPLSRREMEKLLHEWLATDSAGFCPHGRPTVIRFERHILEKSFLRRGN